MTRKDNYVGFAIRELCFCIFGAIRYELIIGNKRTRGVVGNKTAPIGGIFFVFSAEVNGNHVFVRGAELIVVFAGAYFPLFKMENLAAVIVVLRKL